MNPLGDDGVALTAEQRLLVDFSYGSGRAKAVVEVLGGTLSWQRLPQPVGCGSHLARVPGIGRASGLVVSLPVTGDRPWVDRVDGEPGTGQRDDRQVLVCLDRDRRVRRAAAMRGDEVHDAHEAGDAGPDPFSRDHLAVVVDERLVMVGLGSVDPAADGHGSSTVGDIE
jgi:hypothetical protein